MDLYKNTYRTQTTRLPTWDYASDGYYFVTICTRDKRCYFGAVADGMMQRVAPGDIAAEEWQKTAVIRPYVTLDTWVLMPNHLHGILIIQNEQSGTGCYVSADTLKSGSLGAIINQYKSMTTKRIRRRGWSEFAWQPRFYDHVIRTPTALQRIR